MVNLSIETNLLCPFWSSIFSCIRGSTLFYYMASSASGQDDQNRVLWLSTRAGKMEPSCPLGTTHCIPQEKFPRKPCNKSFIDQVCSVKMAGYWPRPSFFASLWASTSSRSINTQKRTWPISMQPSWPHTWSITHTSYLAIYSAFICSSLARSSWLSWLLLQEVYIYKYF